MARHNDLGKLGEDKAVSYLLKNQFIVLARNYRFDKAEVDIFAIKNNRLHCIEVKTRSSTYFGAPESFVTEKKESLMIDAAEQYMEENDIDLEVCFDIIEVYALENFRVHHIIEAFYA